MKRIVDHPWFLILELLCITLGLVLWTFVPGLIWQPLIISIFPLLLRILAGRSPFERTPFDLPIAIFLLTAAVGVWAAYQPATASLKFELLFSSVLFYYLLSRQPLDNLWKVAIALSVLGFGICVYFILSNNWEIQTQKFQIIRQIGLAWMRVRPDMTLAGLHPNDTAGIAVITLPFTLALTLRYWRKKSYLPAILFGFMAGLVLATVLLSSSRGAWVAVGAVVGSSILWWVISRGFKRRTVLFQRALFFAIIALVISLTLGNIWISFHQNLSQVALGTSNEFVLDSRFHVFWSAFELIKDVPFTGGGLGGFPGLYSSYIMINPNFIFGYSHNIFLDAMLQQGILGGLMLFWVYFGSFLLLVKKPFPGTLSYLRLSVLSSLFIIVVHGLVDNTVLRSMFTVSIFFIPGMAVSLVASTNSSYQRIRGDNSRTLRLSLPAKIILLLIIVGFITFRRPLISAWYTDMGAVAMAKVELADFPTGSWETGYPTDLLSPAMAYFQQALTYDHANPRAHYRLGLLAMQNRDFTNAIFHLSIAHQGDPYHRGMIKALGLSYLWNGEVKAALPYLSVLPESTQEVEVYSWWWDLQGRPDLANFAAQYLTGIESGQ